MSSGENKLAYLLVASPVQNVFIGGLMVIDQRGLPVEFRYTEPIQPTRIQQILYGSVLSRYIKTEVILDTLLGSLESNPQLLVVNDDSYLTKESVTQKFNVVRLTETKSGPLKAPGTYEKISGSEFLLQLTHESSPVRVQMSSPGAPAPADSKFESTPAYACLMETGQSTDVLEPLGRVERALSALCQEAGIKASASS